MSDHIQDLFPFYALGALTEEENQQVETYLKQNPGAEAELKQYLEAAALIPLENEPLTPSPDVKEKLMQRVNQSQQLVEQPRHNKETTSVWQRITVFFQMPGFSFIEPAAVAVTALMLFLFIRLNTFSNQIDALKDTIAQQQEIIDRQQALINQQEETLAQLETILAVYSAPSAQTIVVNNTGLQPNATGKITIDHSTRQAVLDVAELFSHPNSVYQLWFIQGDVPISAGVFDVNDLGSKQYFLPTAVPENFDAIGVSVEPPGGSETPSDEIVLLGTT